MPKIQSNPLPCATPSVAKWLKEQVPTQADLTMEKFRREFKLIAKCYVHPDGNTMRYTFHTMHAATTELKRAHVIIQNNRLPLMASMTCAYTEFKIILKYIL